MELKEYSYESKNERGNYESYFYGIIRNNDDGSKTCCGYYQSGLDLMTVHSDVAATGGPAFKINDYGATLSGKMLFEFNDPEKMVKYMTELVRKCAFMDEESLKEVLSSVGNVVPEWVVEKYNDPMEVFTEIEKGRTLEEIVGPARNASHNYTAYEQEPKFDTLDMIKGRGL